MSNVTIALITDIHIPKEGDNPMDIDVRAKFRQQIEAMKQDTFDELIVAGDLCFKEGTKEIYQWVKSYLDELNVSYYIIPGNHDNRDNLIDVFDLFHLYDGEELYYKKTIGDKQFLFLDSGKGYMLEKQFTWLQDLVPQLQNDVTIFMHHPPTISKVPHMDNNFAFQNMDRIQSLLKQHDETIDVFCGHYHVEKFVRKSNLNVYITPSPFFNLSHEKEDFYIENQLIGWRKIIFEDDKLYTFVNYTNA